LGLRAGDVDLGGELGELLLVALPLLGQLALGLLLALREVLLELTAPGLDLLHLLPQLLVALQVARDGLGPSLESGPRPPELPLRAGTRRRGGLDGRLALRELTRPARELLAVVADRRGHRLDRPPRPDRGDRARALDAVEEPGQRLPDRLRELRQPL